MKNSGLIGLCLSMKDAELKGFKLDDSGTVIVKYEGDLEHVEVPQFIEGKLIRSIGQNAFEGKKLKTLNLPLGLGDISSKAFKDCGLSFLDIPETVYNIDEDAFEGNERLKLTIPNNAKLGKLSDQDNLVVIKVPIKSEYNFIMDTRKLLDEYNTPDTLLRHYLPVREQYGQVIYVRSVDLKTVTTREIEGDMYSTSTYVIDENESPLPTGLSVNTRLVAREMVCKVLYRVYDEEVKRKEKLANRGLTSSSLFSR